MTAAEYRRLAKRLWRTKGEAAAALNVNPATEWRYRQEGCGGPAERLVHALALLQKTERDLMRCARQLARFQPDRDRVTLHERESKRGAIPAAVVRPRKRKGKAELRQEAERAITK